MIGELEAEIPSNSSLSLLNDLIVKLFDPATLKANDVVVMIALIQLEYRLSTFEVMAFDQTSGLKLGQNTIDGRETHLLTRPQQGLVNVLRGHVQVFIFLQQIEDLHARQGYLQARIFQIFCAQP